MSPHIYAGLETNVLEKHVQHVWCAAGCSTGVMRYGTRKHGKEEEQTPSKNATFLSLGINSVSIVQSTAETDLK